MLNHNDRTNNQTLLTYAYLKAFFGIAYQTLDALTEISAWLVRYAAILETPVADDGKKQKQNPPERGDVFHTANTRRYSHAGNNPILLKDPDGRFSIKGSFSFLIGPVPVVVKLSFGYNDGIDTVGVKIGIGVGAGFSADFSDLIENTADAPEPGYTAGLYTDLTASAEAPLLGEVGIDGSFAHLEVENGEGQPSHGSATVTVPASTGVVVDTTFDLKTGDISQKMRASLGAGKETSAMIIGGGVEFRFNNDMAER